MKDRINRLNSYTERTKSNVFGVRGIWKNSITPAMIYALRRLHLDTASEINIWITPRKSRVTIETILTINGYTGIPIPGMEISILNNES